MNATILPFVRPGGEIDPPARRLRTSSKRHQREVMFAIMDEHLAHIEHSLGRLRALTSELKAATRTKCYADEIRKALDLHRTE